MASIRRSDSDALAAGNQRASRMFKPFDLPSWNQRQLGPPHPPGTSVPLALKPCQVGVESLSLDETIATVKGLQSKDKRPTTQLALHGGLLCGCNIKAMKVNVQPEVAI